MTGAVLSARALNRATLARQGLLARRATDVVPMVRHLVGLQAQVPLDPYLALWSRIDGFDPAALGQLVTDRELVRIVVMRGTLHLVTADDAPVLRSLAQPVLDAELARHPDHAPHLHDVDLTPVLAAASDLLREPRTPGQLREELAARFPRLDAAALAYACRNHLGLVQAPPRGVWGRTGGVRLVTVDAWLGRPLATDASIDEVVVRYLAAFGPATAADVAAWSRLTGMREVLERVAPRLRTYQDERGRVLYDVPDAPLPSPDTDAPPRFLPEYDNVLLSHADRSRFGDDERRARLALGTRAVRGTVLVDGTVTATWAIEQATKRAPATLVVHHLPWSRAEARAVRAEAEAMVRFRVPEAPDTAVRFHGLP